MNNNLNSGLGAKVNGHFLSQKSYVSVDHNDHNCTQSQSRLVGRRNVFSAHLNGELKPKRSLINFNELNLNKHPNYKPQNNPFDKYGCILPRHSARKTRSAPALIKSNKRDDYNIEINDSSAYYLSPKNKVSQTPLISNPQNVIHTLNIPKTIRSNGLDYNGTMGHEMVTPDTNQQTYREDSTECRNVGPVEAAKRYLRDALETRRATFRADMAHDNPDFDITNGLLTGRQIWHKLFQHKCNNSMTTDSANATSTNILKKHKSIEGNYETVVSKVQLQEISKFLKSAKESPNVATFTQYMNNLQNAVNWIFFEQLLPTLDNLDKEYNKPLTMQMDDIPTVREESMDDNDVDCDQLIYDACTISAKRNLDGLGTCVNEIYDVNDEFMSTDPLDYATLVTRFGKIFYSPKLQTDKYIYRYIILPKQAQDTAEALCKQRAIFKKSEKKEINSPVTVTSKSKFVRLLDEVEILRQLGIHMSSGWQHFFVFKNSMREIILRRRI